MKHRVLIADASPTVRSLLRSEFDPEIFEVFEVDNGSEAVRMALEIKPTIATLSIILPGCNGIEACSAITSNEQTAKTTVVMITAKGSEEDQLRAFEAGAVRFLCKGFPSGELATYAQEIVQSRDLLSGTRILIADDNAFIRKTITRLLGAEGAIVFQAEDGAVALSILDDHEVDVILTDYHMPNMDGIEFLRQLRKRREYESTPVLFLSASEYRSTTVRALDAGANDFIRKPFEATELLARVRSFTRMAELTKGLKAKATTDELTGLLTRREAVARLDELCAASLRYSTPFSCIMLDVDHFKTINDDHGHAAGDAILRSVSDVLRKNVRITDSVCRIGGEEFLILCAQTPLEAAVECAEKIRLTVEKHVTNYEKQKLKITISLGVAAFDNSMNGADAVMKTADKALYQAKGNGRNQVYSDHTTQPQPAGA